MDADNEDGGGGEGGEVGVDGAVAGEDVVDEEEKEGFSPPFSPTVMTTAGAFWMGSQRGAAGAAGEVSTEMMPRRNSGIM